MRRRDKERRSRIGGKLVLAMRVPEIPAVGRVGFRLVCIIVVLKVLKLYYHCPDLVQVRKYTACTQNTRQCVSSSGFLFST